MPVMESKGNLRFSCDNEIFYLELDCIKYRIIAN